MMKMNAGAWIGIIGGIIGLLVGVGAVVSTGGSEGTYVAAGMLLLFGGMFYLFYRLFFKSMINASRLQKTGLQGTAIITAIRDTGITINNSPQVKLTLEVKNSLGQKYTTQTRVLVPRINPGAYQPGMQVPVRIDPRDEMNVVLDFTGTATSTNTGAAQQNSAGTVQSLISEIGELQKEQESILLSGRSARAIIKQVTMLGVKIQGDHPYVELDLEVLPDNSPSFGGKARGVIAAASLPKFQPGCTIHVKYDLYDNSRIAIEHS